MQSPMISAPLKQTNEIDWVAPLKQYIKTSYSDDPERYDEECNTLNRLRQDMRGAGKESASGRDLLYRYYGQLELLDLRFPVDESHIKISFTWFDAFTHKPTSQYSLAFEKASIIFNISAVLSCHAAFQDRHEETGLKTAYHSFQASAGMFTYINENFLHAPSTDLSRETIKTLITLTLAQAQEVFLEKQIADGKKVGLLAKLAAQATYLYNSAAEGIQESVSKGIFERVWLSLVQVKQYWMASVAQYHQALADDDANSHGVAIARLQAAVAQAKEATKLANSFPSSVSPTSNLSNEAGSLLIEMTRKHLSTCTEKLTELTKDNDFIYHQIVPAEASLTAIPKLPAAKAIPVNELYKDQDITRIIGQDIFQRIVPMSVTESASLYDEEKAKLIRAEAERVEVANDELAASLDYLKLPGSLNILKGGLDQENGVDPEFRRWCEELSGYQGFGSSFEQINNMKGTIFRSLDDASRKLDMEESVCEKMRAKCGPDWTQEPSSRLTSTLRSDIRSYRSAIEEAAVSDGQLFNMFRQNESDMEEMRSAGETDEADVLYQRAMVKAGAARTNGQDVKSSSGIEGNLLDDIDDDSKRTVTEQIAAVEELVRKLNLVKRERVETLKNFKEKIHLDDISNVLILSKKGVTMQENQIFKIELDKFRPYQNRLLQTNHKQSSLIKELTRTYGELLSDKRVKSEQNKYESFSRQRGTVLKKYRAVHQTYVDLKAGLDKAKQFYSDMKETVDSLGKNVEGFVNNRRVEGGQMLKAIENAKAAGTGAQGDRDHDRLKDLMERMSVNPSASPASVGSPAPPSRPPNLQHTSSYQSQYGTAAAQQPQYPHNTSSAQYGMASPPQAGYGQVPMNGAFGLANQGYSSPPPQGQYNPSTFGQMSPPPNQQQFYSPPPGGQGQGYGQAQATQMPPYPNTGSGFVPPPPPGGRPQPNYGASVGGSHPSGPGGYANDPRRQGPLPQQQQSQQQPQAPGDPWAGLNAWGR
ncbi:vacuolar protein-sorting protein bro1 [Myriangium duriaei CBS 260.36]|uniref:BRO domain-containing protein 1 n=1 Tax=Myriangium duriaei CBS 260.36 TaxID=1168546 RepID=A0A9P4IYC1_9PEZI|nr:vacuolar protein-sorting protein bro1 [Myriangium duriaei CBS 260.36]